MTTSIQNESKDIELIERDLFFGNPEISFGQLSPNGEYISFMKEYNSIMNIWVKKVSEPFEKAKILTRSYRPIYTYFWSFDSKNILYLQDENGDENINIFVINITNYKTSNKNLTPLKKIRAEIYLVSKKNPDIIYIGLNDRDKAWHDLYKLIISSGKLIKIYNNINRIVNYYFDWNETLQLMSQIDKKGNNIILKVTNQHSSLTPIYTTNISETAYPVGFNENNSKIYLVTNKGNLNLTALYLMDLNSQKMTFITSDPKNKVDINAVYLNNKTKKINFIEFLYDKIKILWKDKKWEKIYYYLKSKFPNKEITFISTTLDQKKFLFCTWSDIYTSEVFYYDLINDKIILEYIPRKKLKSIEHILCSMNSITYKSRDGLDIPAYLTLPKIGENKNLPTVILVHGGPKGPRDNWGYDSEVQFLANRGYAVLQPNFRGSGGYGKKFLNAGDLQWGKLMQDDITWGVKYLINKNISDKNKIAIMGASYGGYATLAGLAFTPDLYACGIDIVGPSNIFTLINSIPPYWESGKSFLYQMVGDPNTENGKKLIKEASPLFSVDKIKKPLLIIQGANDPRVKQKESDQIVLALKKTGKLVNYLLANDEGHGFRKSINTLAMYAKIEKFLHEIIGGRVQFTMSKIIEKRLKEMTVNNI